MRSIRSWALILAAAGTIGCASEPGDFADGDDPIGVSSQAASRPGNWSLPADVAAAGAPVVRYDDPPAWDGGAHCSGTFTEGASELREYLLATYDGISEIYGYSCRQNTANAAQTSMHGTGRAIDVMIPMDGSGADNDVGDEIGNWLVSNSASIGVQYIIWDRTSWNGSRTSGDKTREYTGPNPHTDHLHVELNTDGANRETPWFSEPAPPPPPPPPVGPALDARFVAQGSDAAPETDGSAQLRACVGSSISLWFELENLGRASWVDLGDAGTTDGQSVRLGVEGDSPDPLGGGSRISVDDSTNPDVRAPGDPAGEDCNDHAGCRRTVFTIRGTVPTTPGVYRSQWKLVDELRSWFGPEMWQSVHAIECAALDGDGDGASVDVDCDDANPARRPGGDDVCGDGVDQDCDGADLSCTAPPGPGFDPDAPPMGVPGPFVRVVAPPAGGAVGPGSDPTDGKPLSGGCSAVGLSAGFALGGSPSWLAVLGALSSLVVLSTRRRRRR